MVVDHKIVYINGREIEIQAKQVVGEKFLPEWSFDGRTFQNLNKTYDTSAEAMLMARMGAFLGSIHVNKLKERGES